MRLDLSTDQILRYAQCGITDLSLARKVIANEVSIEDASVSVTEERRKRNPPTPFVEERPRMRDY